MGVCVFWCVVSLLVGFDCQLCAHDFTHGLLVVISNARCVECEVCGNYCSQVLNLAVYRFSVPLRGSASKNRPVRGETGKRYLFGKNL